jgi:hypothetical protein
MTTYREFQSELERLHQDQERDRRRDKALAIARIKAMIAEYQLTADELDLDPR